MYESEQVVLRIIPNSPNINVKTPDGVEIPAFRIHKIMDHKRVWKNDAEGKYVELLFDGKPIVFRPGKVVTVGKTIANALMRSSVIIVGMDSEALTAPMCPYLQIVEQYAIGTQTDKNAPTMCPWCNVDQKTRPALARHLMEDHVNENEQGEKITIPSIQPELADVVSEGE